MATIPKQHRAAVYAEPGKVLTKVETVDTPESDAGEVLVICVLLSSLSYLIVTLTRRDYGIHSGVCHSDLGVMTNSWAALPYQGKKNKWVDMKALA